MSWKKCYPLVLTDIFFQCETFNLYINLFLFLSDFFAENTKKMNVKK